MTLGSTALACTGAGMGAWGLAGSVLMIGFWGLVIWGGIALARRAGLFASGDDAERALARRYAEGDIDDEEYRRRLTTLGRERRFVGDRG